MLNLLAEQIEAVRNDEQAGTLEKARCIGYLGGIALKAVEIADLSDRVWTKPTTQAPRGTRWFYERSRGQYADELAAQNTPAGRKRYRIENPSNQKFTKTDLAKFRLSWEQRPQVVSRGAQKCFAQFMINVAREGRRAPDETEFRRTIALGIPL